MESLTVFARCGKIGKFETLKMYLYYGFDWEFYECSCDNFVWLWGHRGNFLWLDSLSAGECSLRCTEGFVSSKVASRSISCSMREVVFRSKLWIFSKVSAKLSSSMQSKMWHAGFCNISVRVFAVYPVILKACVYFSLW